MSELVLRRGIGAPSKCKSCGAVIVFARTTSSKAAPFELDPNGLWSLENGASKFIGTAPVQLELGQTEPPARYTSHFATCPQRDQWRSRK